jgi:hypothetical protein
LIPKLEKRTGKDGIEVSSAHAANAVDRMNAPAMIRREEIERILHDDLERARMLFDAEADEFRKATNSMTPSDLADPDGTLEIRAAGTKRRTALMAYSRALQRFNAFILNGVVPEDLK